VPVAMAGVRMGERLLQIGIDDAALAAALAGKVGLSGTAALAVDRAPDGERARVMAAAAGVLVDIQVAPWRQQAFAADSFDLVVVQSSHGLLAGMTPEERVACLQFAYRVLRHGGRILVIESAPRGGLAGLLRKTVSNPSYDAHGGAAGALKAEGFRPVRSLGEHEGYRFTEGLKT